MGWVPNMRRFTGLSERFRPFEDRHDRLVEGYLPSKAELYRYYAKGPERYWHSCLDADFQPSDVAGRFRLEAVLDLLSGNPSTILDIGCGSGLYLTKILRQFPDATAVGLDLSEAHLHSARDLVRSGGGADRCTFVQADAEALPLLGSFDAILCVDVLEHLLEPEKLVSQLPRLCHRNTDLVISVPQIYRHGEAGTFELSLDGETHYYFHDQYDLGRISALLMDSGFRVLECVGTHFTFPKSLPIVSYLLRKATRESSRLDRQLNSLTHNLYATNLVLRCDLS